MARRRLKKRIFDSPITHFVLAHLVSVVLRVLSFTCRKELHFPPSAAPYMSGEKPGIFCFWHGRMLMQLFMKPKGRPMFVLSSRHSDGSLTAALMRLFDIDSIRGSKKLGGAQAVRGLMHVTERGGNISLTPDGPRGPFQTAADGAAFVASKTSYPLICVSYSATRHWRFRSWDKFMVPKPFSRICFVVSEPQDVASDSSNNVRAATQILQDHLSQVTAEADQLCGVV